MASASSWKLKALLKKNLLIMKRNICSTICEILFPIILILLLYLLKTVFDINNYYFEIEEIDTSTYAHKRSVFNVDPLPNTQQFKFNISEYGMSILPALNICSIFNKNNKPRNYIGAVGLPDEIKERLINESLFFKGLNYFGLSWNSFINFTNEEQMNNYIKSSSYGEEEDHPLLCFGLSYSENTDKHEYNYSLHYFENSRYDGASDVPKSSYLLDPFQSGPDFNSYSIYQKNGYTYMMKIISDYIYSRETGNNDTKINFGVLPMKYKSYRSDPFGSIVGFIGPFFIIIAYLGHLCKYVYSLVLEKETKAKEGMKIMGLSEGIYFLSFLIQYLITALIDSAINSAIFLMLFTRIPYLIFFLTFFLFSLNIFALAYFFHSFIEKAKESLILSVILYFIMFFLSMLATDDDVSYNMKLGLSFFPPVAIYLGIILLGRFESNFRLFYFKDVFHVFTNYSVFLMFLMLIVDLLLYLFLGYYLLNILPHDYGVRKPWYFLFTPSYWGCKKRKYKAINEENLEDAKEGLINSPLNNNDNFQNEDIYKEMNDPKDSLKIRKVVKRFDDGKVAVNGVSLNFYKNEIFALLGHNGAGKTTLISMLTGLYEATEGEAIYDNMNIFLPDNISIFREKLGICPQHDVLFNDLNIREHLGMFAIFKGVSSNNIENEVNKVIKDFQLEDVQYELSQNLSAGQRRKLSIAISLVGGSEIIFLDEPSSGMDITSRRNLWEILKRQSDNKIIILTTHYMEEASVLGKRIGIINLGKMKCIGTPLFLIEKFGKYMNITLSKDEGAQNDKICQYITNQIDDAKFESLSEEIIARIPKDVFKGENGISLNNFFEDLDNSLNELKIKSYSVSMPTLEDVFLNVAQDDEVSRFSMKLNMQKVNDKALFELNYIEHFSWIGKFFLDFKSNFIRRFYLTIREKKGLIMEILCPIFLVLIGCLISQVDFSYSTPAFGSKNISTLGNQIIYYSSINDDIDIEKYFIKDLSNVSCKNITNFPSSFEEINEMKTQAIYDFLDNVYNSTVNMESAVGNEIDMTSADYVGSYGNLLVLNEPNDNNSNYEFIELINARVTQGVPLYTSAFLEQVLKRNTSNDIKINYQHKVFGKTAKQEMSYTGAASTVTLFLAVAYALIPANFITIIVRERNNNSKHLMKLSGMNIISYWIVNFLYEIIKFYITGGICLLLIYLFDYYTPYLIYFYLLCGPPLILITYVISFLFNDESQAQNVMILFNALIGALGPTVIIILRTVETTHYVGIFLEFVFCLLPSFCFSFAYSLAQNKLNIYRMDFNDNFIEYFKNDAKLMEEILLLLGPFYFLCAEIVVYLAIIILIELLSNRSVCPQRPIDLENNDINRDSKVIKEEERAQTEKKKSEIIEENLINLNSDNYMIRVKNLQKEYKSTFYKLCCCCKNKGKLAIKKLNFCLERGECFGLLGLNGAGKTTVFKCITQELSSTSGEIFLNGIKINNNFGEIKNKFGYCPQYDAIFEYLTVYENLEFYAKLKGVRKDFLTQIVNAVIYEMKLDEFIKKMAGRLSGGNKRKLSVAIAMLCNPPIILLDEPSTGMDPEARRFMWSIIHKMSIKGKKSSIIMTTHSMDEAETLCKRMGIMVNGEFVCMGKANEIKNKYGYGYELNVRIKPMTEELEDELFINKYNLDKNTKVTMNNIEDILSQIKRKNYMDEIQEGRLGRKLIKDMEKPNGISINHLLNWIFYVQNAIKLMQYGKDNFSKIIIEENMDNSFLFKMKKKEENNKSIGYLFGLFESHKEECYVTEYSIQPTSLEQIFNKFAQDQGSQLMERRSTIVLDGDVENIAMNKEERRKTIRYDKIVLNEYLVKKLLDEE